MQDAQNTAISNEYPYRRFCYPGKTQNRHSLIRVLFVAGSRVVAAVGGRPAAVDESPLYH